jgi:hypothetical protein
MNEATTKKTSPAKQIIKWAAIVFVASCLFPPWQYTAGSVHSVSEPQPPRPPRAPRAPQPPRPPRPTPYGNGGFHSRKPAGYSLLFDPPTGNGVQIDFGRLFLEWAALATVTGTFWVLVVKPAWPGDDKANRPQKSQPPTGNPEN